MTGALVPANLFSDPFHDFYFILFGLHMFSIRLFLMVLSFALEFFFPIYPQLFFDSLSGFFIALLDFSPARNLCCLHLFFLDSSSYIFLLLTLILRGTSFTLGDQPFLIDCQLLLLKLICILCSYCARQRTSDFE